MVKYRSKMVIKLNVIMTFHLYVLCFLLIVDVTCIWVRQGILYNNLIICKMFVPLCVMVICIIKATLKGKLILKKEFFIHFFLISVCVLFSVINNFNTLFYAIMQILIFFLSFLLLSYVLDYDEIKKLFEAYINIMLFIASISLFFFIFGSVLGVLHSNAIVVYEWDKIRYARSYYGVYFEPMAQITDMFNLEIIKNCGIFTEGTMFGFMLNIAYMLNRNKEEKQRFKTIIFAVTILTTLSSMPILSLLIFESIMFVFKKQKSKQLNNIKIFIIPIAIIMVPMVFYTAILAKMTTRSYGIRSDHLIGCFNAFIDNFPFGVGYGNREYLFEYFKYEQGLSIGIAYWLAMGGVGALILLVAPLLKYICHSMEAKQWDKISFALTFLWIFFCTNLVNNSAIQWLIITVIFICEADRVPTGGGYSES